MRLLLPGELASRLFELSGRPRQPFRLLALAGRQCARRRPRPWLELGDPHGGLAFHGRYRVRRYRRGIPRDRSRLWPVRLLLMDRRHSGRRFGDDRRVRAELSFARRPMDAATLLSRSARAPVSRLVAGSACASPPTAIGPSSMSIAVDRDAGDALPSRAPRPVWVPPRVPGSFRSRTDPLCLTVSQSFGTVACLRQGDGPPIRAKRRLRPR